MAFEQWGRTDINVIQISYKWQINNLSQHSQEVGESLISPVFYSGSNNEERWQLEMYPGGEDDKVKDHVSLFLKLKTSKKAQVKVTCEFAILDVKAKTKRYKTHFTRKFAQGDPAYGYQNFILRANLFDPEKGYLFNDTLILTCELNMNLSPTHESSTNATEATMHSVVTKHQLVNDLKLFFTETNHLDVTIIAGTETFHAHQVILASRSPVFSAMFLNKDMEESRNNTVKITDIKPDTVREMLRYIYTDEMTNNELAIELLTAAEKYQLSGLKAKCGIVLLEQLNEDNAAEILTVADLNNDAELKMRVIHFINRHQIGVAHSKAYKELEKSHPLLLAEMYRAHMAYLAKKKKFKKDDNNSDRA